MRKWTDFALVLGLIIIKTVKILSAVILLAILAAWAAKYC